MPKISLPVKRRARVLREHYGRERYAAHSARQSHLSLPPSVQGSNVACAERRISYCSRSCSVQRSYSQFCIRIRISKFRGHEQRQHQFTSCWRRPQQPFSLCLKASIRFTILVKPPSYLPGPANYPHELTRGPFVGTGETNCTAARRLQFAPSDASSVAAASAPREAGTRSPRAAQSEHVRRTRRRRPASQRMRALPVETGTPGSAG